MKGWQEFSRGRCCIGISISGSILGDGTLVLIISQSGETADSLAALREAKRKGSKVLGIVNVVGSSIAREADNVMYTWAGPEIAVATTKAYSSRSLALYLLAMKFAGVRGKIAPELQREMLADLRKPGTGRSTLKQQEKVQKFANRYLLQRTYFLSDVELTMISMEGSLKIKRFPISFRSLCGRRIETWNDF